jgi:hypothetical protein
MCEDSGALANTAMNLRVLQKTEYFDYPRDY